MNQLNLDPETAAIMLGLASDPELITDIIARLSPSDALTTAKAVEDADLRNRRCPPRSRFRVTARAGGSGLKQTRSERVARADRRLRAAPARGA